MALKRFLNQDHYLALGLLLLSLALVAGLFVLAYLGTFTRYGADDYCFSRRLVQTGGILPATIAWYMNTSNRYSTMLLVGMSELFGPTAIRYLPALAILLWFASLSWTLSQLFEKLRIPYPLLSSISMAGAIAFYSILLAPNRYQSLYWRSGMVTYFAPLIALSYFTGFILTEIWRNTPRSKPPWIAVLAWVWFGFFFAGGLSETTLAVQGGALGISILAVWFLSRGDRRKKALSLLFIALMASIISLVVIFIAPANELRIRAFGPSAQISDVLFYSLIFAWDFIRETFRTLPTPTFVILFTSVLFGYGLYTEDSPFSKSKPIVFSLIAIALLTYLLIFFSMTPSMYGQHSYPGARALMATRAIMTTGLLAFGFISGMGLRLWFSQSLANQKLLPTAMLAAILLLGISSAYPLYTTNRVMKDLYPWYASRAEQWDARDAQIRQAVSQGVTDLVVVQLDDIDGVMEYKDNNWVNACAAEYYGLRSLRAP